MNAIVLTYDRYRPLADHMIFKYDQLWSDHPFCFRVPFQDHPPTRTGSRVEYRKSPSDIRGTVLTLLEDLDGDEWIYWCIDDKYPIQLDVPAIRLIHAWIAESDPVDAAGVLCSRFGNLWKGSYLTGRREVAGSGEKLLEMKGYGHIWVHQFVRVKVIRSLFESFPVSIQAAKAMDGLLERAVKPESYRLFVTRRNLGIYGESTTRGLLTLNCHESIIANGLTLPELKGIAPRRIVKGEMPGTFWEKARFRLKRSPAMRAVQRFRSWTRV